MTAIGHFISNQQVAGASGQTKGVYNPSTGEVSGQVAPLANVKEVDIAVAAAQAAWPAWSKTPALRRARILDKFKSILWDRLDELAQIVSNEHGKTFDDAQGEVTRGLEVVEFATGIPHLIKGEFSENVGTGVDSHMVRQALGVVAGITPFNFPTMVPMWMFPHCAGNGQHFCA